MGDGASEPRQFGFDASSRPATCLSSSTESTELMRSIRQRFFRCSVQWLVRAALAIVHMCAAVMTQRTVMWHPSGHAFTSRPSTCRECTSRQPSEPKRAEQKAAHCKARVCASRDPLGTPRRANRSAPSRKRHTARRVSARAETLSERHVVRGRRIPVLSSATLAPASPRQVQSQCSSPWEQQLQRRVLANEPSKVNSSRLMVQRSLAQSERPNVARLPEALPPEPVQQPVGAAAADVSWLAWLKLAESLQKSQLFAVDAQAVVHRRARGQIGGGQVAVLGCGERDTEGERRRLSECEREKEREREGECWAEDEGRGSLCARRAPRARRRAARACGRAGNARAEALGDRGADTRRLQEGRRRVRDLWRAVVVGRWARATPSGRAPACLSVSW
jgi:hypothetical protein